jgi:cell division septal protein FtsQ
VLAAAASGVGLAMAAAVGMSPLLRVRDVTWTGLRLPERQYTALESAALGRPLLLLSEADLQRRADLDNTSCTLKLRRHLPSTLEVRVEARRAIAQLRSGAPIDAHGRVLAAEHALAGLPQLDGFALDGDGRRLVQREVFAALQPLFELPTLAPGRVTLDDGALELQLVDSGARVRLDADDAAAQILKLRVFEQSLGGEPMPDRVDLRFQDQIVVRDTGGRDARRSR